MVHYCLLYRLRALVSKMKVEKATSGRCLPESDSAESDDRMWMRMYVVAFGPRVGTSLSRFDSWRDRHALRSLMSGGGYGCVESEPGNRGALLRFAADCGDLRVAEIIETHLGP